MAFADIFPGISQQISDLRNSMDQSCKQAFASLMTAFFQDHPHVKSIMWQQPLSTTNYEVSIANMSCEFSLIVADEMQLIDDLQNLSAFLNGMHYHLQRKYGFNVAVKIDNAQNATVTPL